MHVYINNKPQEVAEHCTIMQLLQTLALSSFNGIAVAVNNRVVRRDQWPDYMLSGTDQVTVITASQGG
jgi:sulfur carrier protein